VAPAVAAACGRLALGDGERAAALALGDGPALRDGAQAFAVGALRGELEERPWMALLELAKREGLNPEGARELSTLEFREAAVIGTAQSTALIAGISRDGVVMTSGLARGLDNADAAHFGFLLATPPILAAGIYKLSDLTGPLGAGVRGAAVVAAVFAAITAVLTVHFLTRYFRRGNLRPFGIYCIVFGIFMVLFTAIAGTP